MTLRNLMAVFLLVVAYPAIASADDRVWAIRGTGFAIASPCAARVLIMPDAADGRVSVHAHADHAGEIDRLVFEMSGAGTILHPRSPHARCWGPEDASPFTPTLTLAVDVPRGAALSINDSSTATYRVGAVGGPLAADLSGRATVEDDDAAATSLDLSVDTNLALHHVAGDVRIDASGHSIVRIDALAARTLSLELSGFYDITTVSGTVGRLDLDASGAGTVSVGGTTQRADLSLSGRAHVRIAHPTGPVERDVSGAATVETGP